MPPDIVSLQQVFAWTNGFEPLWCGREQSVDTVLGFSAAYGRLVVKRLAPQLLSDPRLQSERCAALQLFQNQRRVADHASEHPNIARLLACAEDGGTIALVYEYCENGTLSSALTNESGFNKVPGFVLPWQQRLRVLEGAAKALRHLHRSCVYPRGIQAANVGLDANWNAKLLDIGLAVIAPRHTAPVGSAQVSCTPATMLSRRLYCLCALHAGYDAQMLRGVIFVPVSCTR